MTRYLISFDDGWMTFPEEDLPEVARDAREVLRDAKAAGAQNVMNGELMLLHQGAAAFELWTGQAAPLDLMRDTLEASYAPAGAGIAPGAASDVS
jgi:hypothetical protein